MRWGGGKQVAQNTKEFCNCEEAHEDGVGSLNKGQKKHIYKSAISHPVWPRKFHRAKLVLKQNTWRCFIQWWGNWAESFSGSFQKSFYCLCSDGHFYQWSQRGHECQIDISAVRTKWTRVPIIGLSIFQFFSWFLIFLSLLILISLYFFFPYKNP